MPAFHFYSKSLSTTSCERLPSFWLLGLLLRKNYIFSSFLYANYGTESEMEMGERILVRVCNGGKKPGLQIVKGKRKKDEKEAGGRFGREIALNFQKKRKKERE